MTQNTEQNVRTVCEQDGQVQEMHADMVKAVCGRRSDYPEEVFRAYLKRHIVKAEARGAEEQRRKDAEGQEPVAWQRFSPHAKQWLDVGEDYLDHYRGMGQAIRCLYTAPTHVARLVSRIAELTEAEQLARADAEASKAREEKLKKALRHVTWTASEYGLGKIGHESAVNRARAALTREGGV